LNYNRNDNKLAIQLRNARLKRDHNRTPITPKRPNQSTPNQDKTREGSKEIEIDESINKENRTA